MLIHLGFWSVYFSALAGGTRMFANDWRNEDDKRERSFIVKARLIMGAIYGCAGLILFFATH